MTKVYKCSPCNYQTLDSGNWYKHVKSMKHIKNTTENNVEEENKMLRSVIVDLLMDKNTTKNVPVKEKSNNYKCKYCQKEYTRKHNVKTHEANCPNNVTKVVQEEIQKFKDTLQGPNNTSNNIVSDLPPLTEQVLKSQLEKLTLDLIQDGAKGYAVYASTYALKDYVICTDKARKKLKFKEENGDIVSDFGGAKLSKLFFDSIKDKNKELIDREYDLLQKEVARIGAGGDRGDNDLTDVLKRSTMLQTLLYQCNDAAEGKVNELTQAFIRHLTRTL